VLPEIQPPGILNVVLQRFSANDNIVKIFPWEKCREPLLSELLIGIKPVISSEICLIIGPEGGFTDEEYQESVKAGFAPCSLGTRILRSETAVIVALSLVLSWMKEL
jgi:16S rRNA (uracil1498-N3)-methyltransferase